MSRLLAFVLVATSLLVATASVWAAEPNAEAEKDGILFSESFENADLAGRGWYDGTSFRIVGDAAAGKGCIEYEWPDRQSGVKGSSPVRRLFEPTDEVSIRFYLKLSKGWGWSGQNFHPHLTHFLTTENSKWHGPAASHLTLYIEPVGGKLRLAAQDIQNKDMPGGLTQGLLRGGYNGKFSDSREVLFQNDQWHSVEAYFKLNSLDLENDRPNPDGIVCGWFDGKLVVEHTDVVLRSRAIQLGARFKHTLRLDGDYYRWNYWDPAGDWDRKTNAPDQWKHWIGPEHRSGYHALTVAMAEALYDHGVVFNRADMQRFGNTQMQVCWNGSLESPVFWNTGGTRMDAAMVAPALARFEPLVWEFCYGQRASQERLKRRDHPWQGGVSAIDYLTGKYLVGRTAEPTRARYREQFTQRPENAAFLKEIESQFE